MQYVKIKFSSSVIFFRRSLSVIFQYRTLKLGEKKTWYNFKSLRTHLGMCFCEASLLSFDYLIAHNGCCCVLGTHIIKYHMPKPRNTIQYIQNLKLIISGQDMTLTKDKEKEIPYKLDNITKVFFISGRSFKYCLVTMLQLRTFFDRIRLLTTLAFVSYRFFFKIYVTNHKKTCQI